MKRCHGVLIDFQLTMGTRIVHPASVVQNHLDNIRMSKTINAGIFETTARVNLGLKLRQEGQRRIAWRFAMGWARVGDRIIEAIYLEPKTLNGIGGRQREGTTC